MTTKNVYLKQNLGLECGSKIQTAYFFLNKL